MSGRPALPEDAPAEQFGDLHGVERRALAQVVGDDPEVQAVLDGRILPDAADIGGVFAHALDRGDVPAGLALVDDEHARGLPQDLAGLLLVEEVLGLDVHRLGMADEDRHPNAGRGDLDRGVHDLLGLGDHLPFLLGRAVLHEDVDMGNDVEGDLLRVDLGLDLLAGHVDALGLVPELVHRLLAGAGDGLVGRDDDAGDARPVVDRLQRHHHLRGRAVGVGDDVLAGIARDRVRVHLGHDQRHLGVVAIERRVVDHDAASLGGDGRVLLRRVRADREEGDVPAGEVEGVEVLGLQCPVAEGTLAAQRLARGEGHDLVDGKFPLGEDVEHFPAHVARGADDGDAITHRFSPDERAPFAAFRGECKRPVVSFRPGARYVPVTGTREGTT